MILRALSLWRPWSASIVHGPKRVENRTWPPPLKMLDAGPLWLALHAGRKWKHDDAKWIAQRWPEARRCMAKDAIVSDETVWEDEHRAQGIVGLARVARVLRVEDLDAPNPWAFGPWCWELADVHALPEPIPLRGFQGLFRLPLDLERRLAPLCVTA